MVRNSWVSVILAIALFTRALALQNKNAHRSMASVSARSAQHVANPFTNFLAAFDWNQASKPNSSPGLLATLNSVSSGEEPSAVETGGANATAGFAVAAGNVNGSGVIEHSDESTAPMVSNESESSTVIDSGKVMANATVIVNVTKAASPDTGRSSETIIPSAVENKEVDMASNSSESHISDSGSLANFGTQKPEQDSSKVKRSAMGKRLHLALWKESLTSGVVFNRTSRTCAAGRDHCKSLCRWLKLTDKDFDGTVATEVGTCPLFDWSMESSGYVAPVMRTRQAVEAVDCVTEFLGSNVHRDDVGTYILQLEECMIGLSQQDSEKYGVPLEMIANEISDWKKEQSVREGAALVELKLQAAIEQGRKAFMQKSGEAEAVSNLTSMMHKAKSVDGHYMIDDVRTARELMDKLKPIVLARKGLADGEVLGQDALASKNEKQVNSALLVLNVSISTAERLEIGDTTKSTRLMRDDLLNLKDVMDQMRVALFQANVSVRTKLHTTAAIERMNSTIKSAKAANVTAQMPESMALIAQLTKIAEAKDVLKDAVNRARATLADDDHGRKGLADFLADMQALQTALAHANSLKLTSRVTAEAMRTIASLEESKAARTALRDATVRSHEIVLDSSSLNFTVENDAIGDLSGAISWAEHARLEHGMPIARELLKMLSVIRDAKVRMTNAIAVGNASITATAGQDEAIEVLLRSVKEAKALNMTAGAFRAREQLQKLRQQVDARDNLEDAVEVANTTLRTKDVQPGAVEALNTSIRAAGNAGLRVEVILAGEQLERLRALRDALDDIRLVIDLNAASRSSPGTARINDTQRKVNISVPVTDGELKVTDLPEVPGSRDDGDHDFEEHILRLTRSIATAKHYGLVDPEMLEQVAHLQSLQDAWNMVNLSTDEGHTALESKQGLYKASVHIQDAMQLAHKAGLKVGMGKARQMIKDLLALPSVKEELDAAMLQGNISLKLQTGFHDGLMRLNTAIAEAERLDLRGKTTKAEKLRDRLMTLNEAWLHLRASSVQATVALRLEHGEDAALEQLQDSIAEAKLAGLKSETQAAEEMLRELQHMNEAHKTIESAVVPNEDD